MTEDLIGRFVLTLILGCAMVLAVLSSDEPND